MNSGEREWNCFSSVYSWSSLLKMCFNSQCASESVFIDANISINAKHITVKECFSFFSFRVLLMKFVQPSLHFPRFWQCALGVSAFDNINGRLFYFIYLNVIILRGKYFTFFSLSLSSFNLLHLFLPSSFLISFFNGSDNLFHSSFIRLSSLLLVVVSVFLIYISLSTLCFAFYSSCRRFLLFVPYKAFLKCFITWSECLILFSKRFSIWLDWLVKNMII